MSAVTIHLGFSAGAVSVCGFALAAIGMACKCRPKGLLKGGIVSLGNLFLRVLGKFCGKFGEYMIIFEKIML